mgnify:CR=1 FL=1
MPDKLPYRSFTTAFKEAACQRISRGDKVMPLSRELDVPRKLLYNWFNSWKLEGVAGLNRKRGRRLVGRQQVDLDFFRRALRALSDQDTQGKTVPKAGPASSRSSKP